MPGVVLEGVGARVGERVLFTDLSWTVQEGVRAAVVGPNGSGKSTLLRIMAGLREPDEGRVVYSGGARVGYLPQWGITTPDGTVWEEAERAFDRFREMERRVHALGEEAARVDGPQALRIAEEMASLQEAILFSGYYEREGEIHRVLKGLGFDEADFSRPCGTFSGGWQMRIALARLLLERPHVLLLDEPTNYLDLEARIWLRSFLKGWEGAVVTVSHDRDFLDALIDEVVEIFAGGVKRYRGTYSRYEAQRTQEIARLIKAYEAQQKERERLQAFIDRFRANANRASQVQARILRLEKMEEVALPPHLVPVHVRFPSAPPSSRVLVQTEGLGKAYGSRQVLREVRLEVSREERVVIAGPNGAGKTTLLRILAGEDLAYTGTLRYGTGVVPGYFAQDVAERLSGPQTVLEEALRVAAGKEQEARDVLGAFLFRGEEVDKPLAVLSGGERSRLALARLFFSGANLLILDEPTNHLDLHTKDALCDALSSFEGGIVFVSHDAHFNRTLATRVLYLHEGTLREFPGPYDEFLRWWEETLIPSRRDTPHPSPPSRTESEAQRRRTERKALQRRLRQCEREEEELLLRLEAIEEDLARIHREMARPEVYTDGERTRTLKERLATLEEEQIRLQGRWEEVAHEIEALKRDLEN
ncbi:ABC-F family ATP-binding cassette domain-containing protein [Spirochaeta thermophila]|uniref:Transporter n=1 Tax=Winmispira thermophila (strain ATCC 49972 / DSM 6192 / RI 19.B1) TaxID=665571 RepID=E0RQ07_WINT6|nr:ABC-F family ATP-binding cassette domain-containing protein [Spirochaeta thermophila]ADN02860.1 transporter [Spirochaeta thermophila DSM 6192]